MGWPASCTASLRTRATHGTAQRPAQTPSKTAVKSDIRKERFPRCAQARVWPPAGGSRQRTHTTRAQAAGPGAHRVCKEASYLTMAGAMSRPSPQAWLAVLVHLCAAGLAHGWAHGMLPSLAQPSLARMRHAASCALPAGAPRQVHPAQRWAASAGSTESSGDSDQALGDAFGRWLADRGASGIGSTVRVGRSRTGGWGLIAARDIARGEPVLVLPLRTLSLSEESAEESVHREELEAVSDALWDIYGSDRAPPRPCSTMRECLGDNECN